MLLANALVVIKENNSRLVGKQEVIGVRTVEGTISNFLDRSFGPVEARREGNALARPNI